MVLYIYNKSKNLFLKKASRKNEDFLSLLRKALSKDESNKETWFFTAEELRKKKEMSPAD